MTILLGGNNFFFHLRCVCVHILHADTVHTMSLIRLREAFSGKDMPEMSTTLGTEDFIPDSSQTVIRFHPNTVLVAFVEGRPATPSIELGLPGVEGIVTALRVGWDGGKDEIE